MRIITFRFSLRIYDKNGYILIFFTILEYAPKMRIKWYSDKTALDIFMSIFNFSDKNIDQVANAEYGKSIINSLSKDYN